jgi:sugar phosphate isomerase/epimerase
MKTMQEPSIPVCGLSLVAFSKAEEVAEYLREAGEEARFELSYMMSPSFVEEIAPLLRDKVLSVHACCPATEFFPNFASADPGVLARSFADMDETLETAFRFGAPIVVLHPGYATDSAMPSSYAARKVLLSGAAFAADARSGEGSISVPDYTRRPAYRAFAERTMERLSELAERFAKYGVRVAAENLNPRVGYLFQTSDEMVEIALLHPNLGICLDIGHLYISSFAFGFDFLEAIRTIAATGKVLTCHLHGNSSNSGRFKDDHQSLDKNEFPYREALEILRGTGANLILELLEEPLRNSRLLKRFLAGDGAEL